MRKCKTFEQTYVQNIYTIFSVSKSTGQTQNTQLLLYYEIVYYIRMHVTYIKYTQHSPFHLFWKFPLFNIVSLILIRYVHNNWTCNLGKYKLLWCWWFDVVVYCIRYIRGMIICKINDWMQFRTPQKLDYSRSQRMRYVKILDFIFNVET